MESPHSILEKYWGYKQFRPLQLDIIENVLAQKDTLAILPTGGGKSVCFQVPALILPGICLVISPLIALMKDQVKQLKDRGVKAEAIFSGLDNSTINQILNDAIDGHIKFLYLSPERLKTYPFTEALKHLKIGLLAIDEAHCISKWGYDFRPAYVEISSVKESYQGQAFPTVALTATATEMVRKDIIDQLKLKKAQTFVKSFSRENLSYYVLKTDKKEAFLLHFLQKNPGSAIVYAKTRKRTVEIAQFLSKNNIPADFYHAGLSIQERNKKQDHWINSPSGVMVATNAFGMGIDKPNVRAVAHIDLCENLEAYYQESGRAGRDEKPCAALLLYNDNDITILQKNLDQKYPDIPTLKMVYQKLANFYQVQIGEYQRASHDFDLYNFATTFGLDVLKTHYSLKILESQKLIFLSESYFQPAKISILYPPYELEKIQSKNANIDLTIKTLMRIYGGQILNAYVNINENEIVSMMHGSYSKLIETLQFLHKQKIIDYIPQKSLPQFDFINFRYDSENLPINHKELELRKNNDKKALKALVLYTTQTNQCRMAVIQDYFDEKNPKNCNKCDVCLRKNKIGINNDEALRIKNKLYSQLPITLSKLETLVSFEEKDLALKILREAISSGELTIDKFGLIFKS